MRRPIAATFLGVVTALAIASSTLAMDCTNASKSDPTAGAQIVIDATTGNVVWISKGLAERLARGVVDPSSGEGFHGLIALDLDGDGIADVSTWVGVGPDGEEIPLTAQINGPACRGLTSIGIYLRECLAA
jgi:hypothetical protein